MVRGTYKRARAWSGTAGNRWRTLAAGTKAKQAGKHDAIARCDYTITLANCSHESGYSGRTNSLFRDSRCWKTTTCKGSFDTHKFCVRLSMRHAILNCDWRAYPSRPTGASYESYPSKISGGDHTTSNRHNLACRPQKGQQRFGRRALRIATAARLPECQL